MKANYIQKKISIVIVYALLFLLASCKKADTWLDIKRSKSDVVPTTLDDFQALLNTYSSIPGVGGSNFGLTGTDNVYAPDKNLDAVYLGHLRNAYLWKKDIYQGTDGYDFNNAYKAVGLANIALEGIAKIQSSSSSLVQYNSVKGQAYFMRAFNYYNLAQLFCKQYDQSSAQTDLGLQLRNTSDPGVVTQRSTLKMTYEQIISDLKSAIEVLPNKQQYLNIPSKLSAMALLSKLYLNMGDFENAFIYANNVLSLNNRLLNYNSLPTVNFYVFPSYTNNLAVENPELLFYAVGSYNDLVAPLFQGYVDPQLYNSYDNNDLRKSLFYQTAGTSDHQILGTYSGMNNSFCGLATNEVYLIRAECNARKGDTQAAMNDLNLLLSNRFKTGTFVNLTANDAEDALTTVLKERRKELPFTGNIRWEDLRRLNQDPRFAKTLSRIYKGTTYTLPPNDPRYVLPIPDLEIQLSGIPQNQR